MSEHGYSEETVEKPLAGGGRVVVRTLLTPDVLIGREATRLLSLGTGSAPDLQATLLQAALNLQRDGSTRGHREAGSWLIDHADRIQSLVAELSGRPYHRMADDPEAQQIEGLHDAGELRESACAARPFAALKQAVSASVKRVGAHEWDAREAKAWSPIAKLKAAGGRKDRRKIDRRQLCTPASDVSGLDLAGLAKELRLDAEEYAFLRHFKETARSDMAVLLSEKTGEPWDGKRVDRVRKRIEYRWDEIKAAAGKYRTTWENGRSVIRVKSPTNPEGEWTHALLRHLFS